MYNFQDTNITPDGPEVGVITLVAGKYCLLLNVIASYNMDCLATHACSSFVHDE